MDVDGLRHDFSRLTVYPRDSKSSVVFRAWVAASWADEPIMRKSSKYTIRTIPSFLKCATMGFKSFVKTLGLVFKPNGKRDQQKVCSLHGKAKYGRLSL